MPRCTEAFFLPVEGEEGGQRYCLFHPAQGQAMRGAVLYIHPFAEEMNKSRRMAALQSRALSQAGFAVLQMDLLGCGDSSGDFGDASWQAWLRDIRSACTWLRQRSDAPLWLWGLRSGCLLAAEAARQMDGPACNFLLWAPVTSGKSQLQQFLRLKAAADMMGGGLKGVAEGLRSQLAAGQSIEVAGYFLSPGLCSGLEQSALAAPAAAPIDSPPRRMEWIEVSTREDATLSPVAAKTTSSWSEAGFLSRGHIVRGPAFWQTTEIEDAPELIAATVSVLTSPSSVQA